MRQCTALINLNASQTFSFLSSDFAHVFKKYDPEVTDRSGEISKLIDVKSLFYFLDRFSCFGDLDKLLITICKL